MKYLKETDREFLASAFTNRCLPNRLRVGALSPWRSRDPVFLVYNIFERMVFVDPSNQVGRNFGFPPSLCYSHICELHPAGTPWRAQNFCVDIESLPISVIDVKIDFREKDKSARSQHFTNLID
jgi:hypothetical protein